MIPMATRKTSRSFVLLANRWQSVLLMAAAAFVAVTVCPVATAEENLDATGVDGALVICGGGPVPDEARDRFIRLADGPKARLVIIPSGSDDDTIEADGRALLALWKARGPAETILLHTRSRETADDEQFAAPLRKASGVWFSGGKQTVLARTYVGTAVERELHALLKRGGVIGGTSAGAAIMSGPMIVRGKLFESPGFGLLPGAIIDQHYLARDRQGRLLEALQMHPGLFGAGVDEGTALVVRGNQLEAIGASTVTICFSASGMSPRRDIVLKHGQTANLTQLRKEARSRAEVRAGG